jgi:hypothetical protein
VDVSDGLGTQSTGHLQIAFREQVGIEPIEHRRCDSAKLSASEAGEHM